MAAGGPLWTKMCPMGARVSAAAHSANYDGMRINGATHHADDASTLPYW